jgi:2-keto-3-deoxy-L-rhamnonate aldolase RhmA
MGTFSLKKRLFGQDMSIGIQCFSGSPTLVEILGSAGFDWVSLDMEHSPTTLESIEHLARAAKASGTTALARVAELDPIEIMRALDRGVDGVIIPHIKSVADAEAAVAATRYPPNGIRGTCTSTRASGYGIHWKDYVKESVTETLVVSIIEDPEALDVFDDIVKVDGADVFWLGTRDLTQSMGLQDEDLYHPKLAEIARMLCSKAKAAGKLSMCTVGPLLSIEYAQYLHSLGFQCLSYGTDVKNFGKFASNVVASLRKR